MVRLASIYKHIKKDLELVEQRLAESIVTDESELMASSGHLLKAGGKRMRPVFVLLAGRFGNYDKERLISLAVALELVHMATLVHDDVIDNAATRRGKTTVKALWDNRVAMFTGDFIIARALKEMSIITEPEVHQALAQAIYLMCGGEIDQIRDLYQPKQSIKQYLSRIQRKTALLMSISCHLGALVSGANPKMVQQIRLYGYYVGMAFQLTDDVLDITGDEKTLGKPAGSDLQQGNVTLPVIYALQRGNQEERAKLEEYLISKGNSGSVVEALEIVRKLGGGEFTLGLSERYLQKALHQLTKLPHTLEQELLKMLAEFIVGRTY
jgi:heptaprenyl diphosphate synthase